MAMGMNIKPRTCVAHKEENKGDMETKKDGYKKWKCNAFQEPSIHIQYHYVGLFVSFPMLYTLKT